MKRFTAALAAVTALVALMIVGVGAQEAGASTLVTKSVAHTASRGPCEWIKPSREGPLHYYKINKGTNKGGNHANVNLQFNTEPVYHFLSPDSMIQDNAFHYLNTDGWATDSVGLGFIFDLSGASDPRCAMWVVGY